MTTTALIPQVRGGLDAPWPCSLRQCGWNWRLCFHSHCRLAQPGMPYEAPLLAGNHRRAFRNAPRHIGYTKTITPRDLRHCSGTLSAQGTGDARATQAALALALMGQAVQLVAFRPARGPPESLLP